MRTGFGWIEVRGNTYDHDIVIHTSGEVTKRKKKVSKHLSQDYGHTPLTERECAFIEREHPEVVYIGTGQHGALPITDGARQILAWYSTRIGPTPGIITDLEKEQRPFVAILHVTCLRRVFSGTVFSSFFRGTIPGHRVQYPAPSRTK